MWDLSFRMFRWALLHMCHLSSITRTSGLVDHSTSSMTSAELRKSAVVKEFQCFLFFKLGELKS